MTNSEAWEIVARVLSRRVGPDNEDECTAVEMVADERDEHVRREHLVQGVIEALRLWQRTSGAEAEQNLTLLIALNCKLAEWKP